MRLFAVLSAAVLGGALFVGAASAQEVQERTIRWGHLNNTDHPVSLGVQKFAEILPPRAAASSRSASSRPRSSATRCRCSRRCAAARRK